MKWTVMAALLATGLMGLTADKASAMDAANTPGQDSRQVAMRAFGEARPPIGYVSFCQRHPAECAASEADTARPSLTAERWEELVAINITVNVTIEPATDFEQYNVAEYWTYPDGSGDCEDYVLAKRQMLLERGWPASALLITVVRDEEDLGHAVLTVATNRGDLVLDNKTSDIRFWRDTPYRFQKRQSGLHPLSWVSLNASDGLRQTVSDPVAAR